MDLEFILWLRMFLLLLGIIVILFLIKKIFTNTQYNKTKDSYIDDICYILEELDLGEVQKIYLELKKREEKVD